MVFCFRLGGPSSAPSEQAPTMVAHDTHTQPRCEGDELRGRDESSTCAVAACGTLAGTAEYPDRQQNGLGPPPLAQVRRPGVAFWQPEICPRARRSVLEDYNNPTGGGPTNAVCLGRILYRGSAHTTHTRLTLCQGWFCEPRTPSTRER